MRGLVVELWQVLLLAVVQGVTEFLPISSSGHLVIVSALTGVTDDVVAVNIVLHVGTLMSILAFYWRRIVKLLGEDRRVALLLIVGTIPAAIVGVCLKEFFPALLASPLLAGCMLVVTGMMLLWSAEGERGEAHYRDLTLRNTILIGCSQAFAILPGISRSGATITAGLRLGLSPESASTFSFLLAIPAIGGAGLLEMRHLFSSDYAEKAASTSPAYLAFGAGVAFLVGVASLWWLSQMLKRGRFQWFAWWCIPVGVGVVIWQLFAPAAP